MIRILLQYVLEKLKLSTQTQLFLYVRPRRRKAVPSEILVKIYRYIFPTVKSALLLLFYVFFLLCIYLFFLFQLLYCINTYCLVDEMLHANRKDRDLTCKRIEFVLKFALP